MRRNEKRKKTFWDEMSERPYPFNRDEAAIAQAISPWGGMDAKERAKMILDLSEGRDVIRR